MAPPRPSPPPDNFLALEASYAAFDTARVLILPVPLEATVSWGGGTARGPRAIIEASQQVELYDREHGGEPALEYGIHTLPALKPGDDPAVTIAEIAAAVCEASASGRLVVVLGGEHTISAGVNHGLLDARDGPLTVVQLDAHCDLRDTYEGTPFSHACVARRILEDPRVEQVLQLGVRSVDGEEVAFASAHEGRVRVWYAEDAPARPSPTA
jgi:agmatinase